MGTSVVGCVFPKLPVRVWMERNVMLDRSMQLSQNAETLVGSGWQYDAAYRLYMQHHTAV